MRNSTLHALKTNAVTTFSVSVFVVLFGLLFSVAPAQAASGTGTSSVTTFTASTLTPEIVVETTTGTSATDLSNFLIGVYPASGSSGGWGIEPACSYVYGSFPACGISKAEYKEPSGAWTDMGDSMLNVQSGPQYYIGWGAPAAAGTMFRFTFAAGTFTSGAVGDYELQITAYGSDPASGDVTAIPLSIPGSDVTPEESGSSLPDTGFSPVIPVTIALTLMAVGAAIRFARRVIR